ncbi:DUF2169 domain-containing protein [Massilia sp. CCM 8734]|uniref:DUF2169 family type VI secretion system accessory protein n=1 Tax=Massilia sp. CCM 8734 TaxID=2609283 RepID=UPI001421DAC2|nr:DUF2169 domain-containing protein [Massilia sp. CCM 8734]NHZ97923.1 DUF2169 domain-containing protein [Massilia sp. CCM 8734]
MEFVNETPFPAIAFDSVDQRDMLFHTVVIRITFVIASDGTLAFADEQTPLVATDAYFGEINRSSVRQESDFAPFKPHTDIIVIANGFAPRMRPCATFNVGLMVTDVPQQPEYPPKPYGLNPAQSASPAALDQWRDACARAQAQARLPRRILEKRLIVTGPREWRKRHWLTRLLRGFTVPAWKLTAPAPVVEVPLRYEYAYGGERKILVSAREARRVPKRSRLTGRSPQPPSALSANDDVPAIAHEVFPDNPIGCGYAPAWFLKAAKPHRIAAPQIEAPHQRIKRFGALYAPQGSGVIGRAWAGRLPFAGTYDQQWLDERHPNLPHDFDFRYWNSVAPDQQVTPYLDGDETISLTNLCTPATPGATTGAGGDTELTFTLPGHLPFVLARFESGVLGELPARLDTVVIDASPDHSRPDKPATLVCVWRATMAVEPAVRVLEARMIARDDLASMREAQRP